MSDEEDNSESDQVKLNLSNEPKDDSFCNSILWIDFCSLMEKIESTKEKEGKLKILFSRELKEKMGPNQSLYPFLRLVLPSIDNERGKIGIKQTLMSKTYIDALSLDKKSSDAAASLLYWKDPSKAANNKQTSSTIIYTHDYPSTLEQVTICFTSLYLYLYI